MRGVQGGVAAAAMWASRPSGRASHGECECSARQHIKGRLAQVCCPVAVPLSYHLALLLRCWPSITCRLTWMQSTHVGLLAADYPPPLVLDPRSGLDRRVAQIGECILRRTYFTAVAVQKLHPKAAPPSRGSKDGHYKRALPEWVMFDLFWKALEAFVEDKSDDVTASSDEMEEGTTPENVWNAIQARLRLCGRISFPCVGYWGQRPIYMSQIGPSNAIEFLRHMLERCVSIPFSRKVCRYSFFSKGVSVFLFLLLITFQLSSRILARPSAPHSSVFPSRPC